MTTSNKLAIGFVLLLILMVLFADFMANDLPILAISGNGEWKLFEATQSQDSEVFRLNAPVPYKGGLDLDNTLLGPFTSPQSGHYLGTDHLGRDLLAVMIHGTRLSLGIGIFAILIAAAIGIVVGGVSGFFGDERIRVTYGELLISLLTCLLFFYLVIHLNEVLIFLMILSVLVLLYIKIPSPSDVLSGRRVMLPADFLSLKFMEVFSSIPGYFLIMAIIVFIEPNWMVFAIIIGATRWVGIARLMRGEMIKIRETGYIESARALGVHPWLIFWKHALPNAMGPLPYAITFGIANIIIVESTLSYFGIGLPADSISWGNFLSGFKSNPSAWWIALIPGLVIFLCILSLHVIGRALDSKFNPKGR